MAIKHLHLFALWDADFAPKGLLQSLLKQLHMKVEELSHFYCIGSFGKLIIINKCLQSVYLYFALKTCIEGSLISIITWIYDGIKYSGYIHGSTITSKWHCEKLFTVLPRFQGYLPYYIGYNFDFGWPCFGLNLKIKMVLFEV